MAKNPIIEISNADIYQRENLVLSGVNLTINKGEFVYVIGKVGSGKTSLIKAMNAEIPVYNGDGVVAGFRLSELKHKDTAYLRRELGVIFQDFKLLTDRSVFENLSFVLKATGWKNEKEIKERVVEVLEKVGMLKKTQKMPHELSGGEQQRVVIARAILNNPKIILADEPTGNLDPETSVEILHLLLEMNKEGKTIVMATHDYALISKYKTRTLICDKLTIKDTREEDSVINFDELMEQGE